MTRSLFWIFLSAAVVRLVLWFALRDQPLSIWDEKDYDALARTIFASREYAFESGGELTSLRPPLYPAFVAAIYSVAGSGNLAAVRIAQAVLSIVTAFILYATARLVVSQHAAFWATALFCFYPSLLGFNNLLLTETLFTLLLVATCYCIVKTLQTGSVPWALMAGLVLGFAALTRSILWLSPPLVAVYFLLGIEVDWSRRFACAIALVAGFAAVVSPWVIRNTRLQQTFIAIDTMGGRNFMMGNYQHTPLYRAWDAISITGDKSWIYEVCTTYPPEQRPTQGFVDKLAFRRGVEFVKANPGLTLKRDVVKFFDFWGLERELIAGAGKGYFGSVSKIALMAFAALICGYYAAVLFLGIFGLIMPPPIDGRAKWLLLAVVVYVCGLHTLSFGHSRYHLPIMPILMVFAAKALTQFHDICLQWRRPAFLFSAGLCMLLAASWVWTFLVVDRELLATAIGS